MKKYIVVYSLSLSLFLLVIFSSFLEYLTLDGHKFANIFWHNAVLEWKYTYLKFFCATVLITYLIQKGVVYHNECNEHILKEIKRITYYLELDK